MRADEFLGIVKDNRKEVNFKLGVVADLFGNGTAKITFDGETEASTKQYSYLSSYKPKKGDRVLLAKVGGTYVILGNLMFKEIL
ncbi:MAG TPA: hypothetical protein VK031_04940 [Tissierellaceae bacterium]|nr:hypothetical protein [Tissierellaceae bacterium]